MLIGQQNLHKKIQTCSSFDTLILITPFWMRLSRQRDIFKLKRVCEIEREGVRKRERKREGARKRERERKKKNKRDKKEEEERYSEW